ncbi:MULTISPECIES: hypothetical protein [Clostridium]|uniref:hypothetical protein n=1 Tax=Clostridium TaxID=1485 RepID=UPI00069DD0B3|nr:MULTISPECIES: hypothetical protein [Clostridium]
MAATFQSEPVIKVYGSEDIKLKINDDEVTIKNGDMIGEFPIFKAVVNIIDFSESIGNIEVSINEVWV